MKMPPSIQLFGKKWKVRKRQPSSKSSVGECDDEAMLIIVKPGMERALEQSTVLHECIHAIEMSLGLGLTEKQVLGLEAGMYDLLSSNPRLLSYLAEK